MSQRAIIPFANIQPVRITVLYCGLPFYWPIKQAVNAGFNGKLYQFIGTFGYNKQMTVA